jgi:peptidyl-prolyl cis-trans isomerase B (cyclophilin B)
MFKNRKAEVEAAQEDIDFAANSYQVQLDTSEGTILLDLWPDVAPGHCKNLIGLARIGFYDGVTFHRVIRGFMIQGGCPQGTGTGGPGYTIRAEFNDRPHEPGVLSMARTSNPDSAGSQFFVCLERVPHLDNQYTAFGKTANAESLAAVKAIGNLPTDSNDKPRSAVTIKSAKVLVTAQGK